MNSTSISFSVRRIGAILTFVLIAAVFCSQPAFAGWLYTPPPRVYTMDDKTKKGKPFEKSILSILVVNNDKESWKIYSDERLVAEVPVGGRKILYVNPRNEETSPVVVLSAQKASGGNNIIGRFQFSIPSAYEGYYLNSGGGRTPTQQRVWPLPPPSGTGTYYGGGW